MNHPKVRYDYEPMTEELVSSLWTGIPGTLALVLSCTLEKLPDWVCYSLLYIGAILGAVALTLFLFAMRDKWIDQNRRIAESKDRLFQLAEQAKFLSPEQIRFVESAAHIGVDIDLDGERYLRKTDAPLDFVAEFLSKCYSRTTYPVGNYGEGSPERTWSQQITAALVAAHYATPHAGNHAALWEEGMSKEIVARKLGITLTNPTYPPDDLSPIPGR